MATLSSLGLSCSHKLLYFRKTDFVAARSWKSFTTCCMKIGSNACFGGNLFFSVRKFRYFHFEKFKFFDWYFGCTVLCIWRLTYQFRKITKGLDNFRTLTMVQSLQSFSKFIKIIIIYSAKKGIYKMKYDVK